MHDPMRFCHVVFTDTAYRRRPVNFAPPQSCGRQDEASRGISAEVRQFIDWLFRLAGLDAGWYRQAPLARRLGACLRALRVSGVSEARAAILADRALMQVALGALLIGVSGFFRDPSVFQDLWRQVLPCMGQRRADRPLRIWSVGCAEGQELYSLAMLLAEMRLLERSQLLGTDCRAQATRHAAAGEYCDRDIAGVPPRLRQRYMDRLQGGLWRISPRLRDRTRWRTADALQIVEPGVWDMILCRNVAIYLQAESAAQLWQQLHAALSPGGALVVGRAERPGADGLSPQVSFTPLAPCVFRRNQG
ncbi:CheR family methyltransferase [Fontivita pretiosa]|uniref:CheR family methyltransferase n=1 Tax=Fontivita pretiosa TaxID=2989684 RepID=UPI003D185DF5